VTEFVFRQADVFSSQPLRGNPLAVVVGADAPTDTQMAANANWTNLRETTFLLRPSKYPPAKPGALMIGPLKAAVGVADATPIFWAT
jgi:hypothetical protein